MEVLKPQKSPEPKNAPTLQGNAYAGKARNPCAKERPKLQKTTEPRTRAKRRKTGMTKQLEIPNPIELPEPLTEVIKEQKKKRNKYQNKNNST